MSVKMNKKKLTKKIKIEVKNLTERHDVCF